MGLLDLLIASSNAVLKVLLITALGSFLAMECIDIMGEDTRQSMNRVVFYVFNPALVASNLAKTMTFNRMLMLWFMPLNILITYIVGSVFGWILIQITGAPSHLKGLIIGSCSAGNLGNLLLIIIPEVCEEKGSPFGVPDVCQRDGLAYVSISMACSAFFLWLYVYNIVGMTAKSNTENVEDDLDKNGAKYSGQTSKFSESCTEELLSSKDFSPSEDYLDHSALLSIGFEEIPKVPISTRFKQWMQIFSEKTNLKRLLAPSTSGAIVGLFVGAVPQIRHLLIGESAPLRVIQDSVYLLGNGAIPVVSLILGANLTKGLNGSGTRASYIIGIVITKYILLPLTGILVVKAALYFRLIDSDPLYQFVLLLQFAVPPAMNIGIVVCILPSSLFNNILPITGHECSRKSPIRQSPRKEGTVPTVLNSGLPHLFFLGIIVSFAGTITQLFGAGQIECSFIMLWTYALASISLTLWSTFFMWLVS